MRFSLRLIGDRMNEATMEIRYTENAGYWAISKYRVNTPANLQVPVQLIGSADGKIGKYPAWLKTIVDVARVGGHLKQMDQGPPDAILWFQVDKDLNLLEITFP